jgi:hypothetical protein
MAHFISSCNMVLFYLGKQRNTTQLPVKENALAFNGQRVWIFSAGRFGSGKLSSPPCPIYRPPAMYRLSSISFLSNSYLP